jgi:carbon monoxide dehydrogenase subunit G
MDMSGEYRVSAPRDRVWDALNNPEILKQAVPGCTEMEKTSDTTFEAKVTAKVGPVKANFTGAVTLSDVNAPNGYTIRGEGKGGAAGFAKGGATVTLEADGDGTLLKYTVSASVGGKLAQIGSRLIDATAKKMAADFFSRFGEVVTGDQVEATVAASTHSAPIQVPSEESTGLHPFIWVGGIVVIVFVVLLIFSMQPIS